MHKLLKRSWYSDSSVESIQPDTCIPVLMALREDVIFPVEVFGPVYPRETFWGDLLDMLIFAQNK